jgi:uncharacterized protein (UPF0179 family)
MKSRLGFVSNSSSSSFILDGTKYPVEKVEAYIKNLLDAENALEGSNFTVESICKVYSQSSPKKFIKRTKDFYSHFDSHAAPDLDDIKGEVTIVDSTCDNSIPWPIQHALENIAYSRQHWG